MKIHEVNVIEEQTLRIMWFYGTQGEDASDAI